MVFGKESTPREISKAITAGKIPPQHIGPKSFEVKKQELISLLSKKTTPRFGFRVVKG